MTFRLCAIVPSHDHYRAIGTVVEALRQAGLTVFVIDDGSSEPAREALARLHDPESGVTVVRFEQNQGKGAAVCHGFRLAHDAGFSHAVQVDADGQHDLNALPAMTALAARHPDAVITGHATFDASVPRARRIGRYLTHAWVWVETLSLRITDGLCGFRVYPLAAVTALLAEEAVGQRMDFDVDILVRLFWRGAPVVMVPVRVTYPPDNTSNFDLLKDNWRITRMHTRLVLGMLLRLPSILANRPSHVGAPDRWAAMVERGTYLGVRFSAAAISLLGRRGCQAMLAPVVLYFYLTGGTQREASRAFLARAFAAKGLNRKPGWRDGYRHFYSFAGRAVDAFAAWSGAIAPGDVDGFGDPALRQAVADSRGVLFIVGHVGNADLARALLDARTRDRMTVLVHTIHAKHYNRVLREHFPQAAVNMVQVTEIGPGTAVALKERTERGEWVVIAGDRTPVHGGGRVCRIPFIGGDAPFSQGPIILAALLGCPVYTLFCLREGHRYRIHCEKLADRIDLPRDDRAAALRRWTALFAQRLEHYALVDPFQWYNFFDFWAQGRREEARNQC